jgi:hypothetical protein
LKQCWQEATNAYATNNQLPPSQRKNVKVQDILRFLLATIAYMGICKLPAKEDYFPGNRSDMLPQHTAIYLSKSMFDYLWRNFHVSFAPNDEEFLEPEPTAVPEEEIQEEVIIELINDMMLEDMDMDIDNEEEKQQETQQEGEDEQEAPPHQAWYSTITSFIDHVNRISQKLCKHPGWQVAIDEMLRMFKGKSVETF